MTFRAWTTLVVSLSPIVSFQPIGCFGAGDWLAEKYSSFELTLSLRQHEQEIHLEHVGACGGGNMRWLDLEAGKMPGSLRRDVKAPNARMRLRISLLAKGS